MTIGTAPPEELELDVPVVEVRMDHDEDADELLGSDEQHVDEELGVSPAPLVQARRFVVDNDPLEQARRFEVVRQSIAERSAARRFELAVDPPPSDARDARYELAVDHRDARDARELAVDRRDTSDGSDVLDVVNARPGRGATC